MRSGAVENAWTPSANVVVARKHAADIHLDSDGYGNAAEQAAHRERERRIFRRIVECALTERVFRFSGPSGASKLPPSQRNGWWPPQGASRSIFQAPPTLR